MRERFHITHAAEHIVPLATVVVLTCFLAPTSADPDLWGHLAFGRDMIGSHAVLRGDPYSFTSDRPWVNHEWLSEIIMWAAYRAAGSIGLVVLKLSLAWAAGALLLASWRRYPLKPPHRDALLLVTVLGAWPAFATVRPQMFSIVLFSGLLVVLERFLDGTVGTLAVLPLIFALWVNLHGGWLVGAGALGIFAAVSVFDADLQKRRVMLLIGASAAAALATLCNPYGARMLAFLVETVRPQRGDIVEWHAAVDVGSLGLSLWLIPTLVSAAAIWRCGAPNRGRRRGGVQAQEGRPLSKSSLALVLLLAIGSFRVVRLVSFYAVAVGFILAPRIWPARSPADDAREPTRPGVRRAVLAYLVTICLAVSLFGRTIAMQGAWVPEPEAAHYVSAHHLQGRMLTWFDYGEYAIWHFWPAIRVSMDGRRETVFTEQLRAAHWRIYGDASGAIDATRRLDPDYVWLPANLPVIRRLEADGWEPIFRGPRSTIMCRAGAVAPEAVESADTIDTRWRRVFPGP